MGILISETFETWTRDDLEHGEASDRGYLFEDVEYTFRELVEYIQRNGYTDNSGGDWLTANAELDSMQCGEDEDDITSLHFSHKNDERLRKYWDKAMQFAD